MEKATEDAKLWMNTALETWSLYADATLQISQRLTDFAINAAKEGMSLCGELQTANLETFKEGQTYMLTRMREMPEELKQPRGMVQKNMREFSRSAENVSKLIQNNTQAILRSSEHYWLTAQQTGNGIKNTYTQLTEKLTALYQPS